MPMRPLLAVLFALLGVTSARAQAGDVTPALEATLAVPPFTSEQVAYFGTTLAIDGDHAAASGEKQNRPGNGVVHALKRSQGRWVVHQEIAPPDGEEVHFGADIAIEGDLMFVGAPGREYDSTSPPGSVYVYVLAGDEWALSDVLVAPPPAGPDLFGASLDFDGERLLVGAPYRSTDQGAGAAYVYERRDGVWALADSLTSPFEQSYYFGGSVALDGPNAVVTDVDPNVTRGNAYRLDGGVWTWTGDLMPETADLLRRDAPLSLDGGRLAVGSPWSMGGDGAVVILELAGGVWARKAVLLDDGGLRGRFGTSVDLDGDRLAVGAPRLGISRVLVYAVHGTEWTRQAVLTGPQAPSGHYLYDDLGASVALDGGHVLAGAPSTTVDGLSRAGAVVAFEEGRDGWAWTSGVPVGYPRPGVRFGADVALWGSRVAVGAPRAGSNPGSVHVYSVTADGAALEARLSETNTSGYGEAVALGPDQLMVGAPGQEWANRVFVYSLGPGGWTLTQTIAGPGSFGAAIDLDGDRALVGAPGAFDAPFGQAFLYERVGGTWGLTATLRLDLPQDSLVDAREFGTAVALDGPRAVVAAPSARVDSSSYGAAYVYELDGAGWRRVAALAPSPAGGLVQMPVSLSGGRALVAALTNVGPFGGGAYVLEGLGLSQTAVLPGPDPGHAFGIDAALDGERALVVGADLSGNGLAYFYTHGGAGWSQRAVLQSPRPIDGDEFGASVAIAGRRLAIGAPNQSSPVDFGMVYLYRVPETVADEASPLTGAPRLLAPRPNPSSGTSRLVLSLAQPERVTATVFDALGRSVQTLLDGVTVSGDVTLTVGGGQLAPGLYVVRVVGDTFAESARLVVAGRRLH